jgi:hypothetical protein
VLEHISKTTVHQLDRLIPFRGYIASEPRQEDAQRWMRLRLVLRSLGHIWSAVDVDSGKLLALEDSYSRSCLNSLIFLRQALKIRIDKLILLIIVDA